MKDNKVIKILLYASLVLNMLFIYVVKAPIPSPEVIEIKKTPTLSKVYDLKKFRSVSYPTQHLERRLDRMYKAYLIEKKTAREKRYTSKGKVKKDWRRRCNITLRRISVINAQLEVLEKTALMMVGDDEPGGGNKRTRAAQKAELDVQLDYVTNILRSHRPAGKVL